MTDVDELREEVERLRRELAAARRMALRSTEAEAAAAERGEAERAGSAVRTAAAEMDARAAWERAAELGISLGRRIAEGQARLIAAQSASTALEHANAALSEGQVTLALREADLRSVIESAIDCAIVTTDRQGLVLAWNPGARRLLGWDENAVLGSSLAEAVAPEGQAGGVLDADVAAALAGERLSREGWLRRQDGGVVWAGIEAMALRADNEDQPFGVLWMLRDRSLERAAAAALRDSEEHHRLLVGSIAQAVWETDAEGRVVADSPSWRAYTGQGVEAWLAQGFVEAIHPDDRDAAGQAFHAAIAGRRPLDAEFRIRHAASGEWRWTNARAAPVTGPDGTTLKWMGMNIDISARKAAEAEARAQEAKYRTLFDSMYEGFCIIEMLFDAAGRPEDYRFLEANGAFERHTGLQDAMGRRIRELVPGHDAHWFEIYGRIALTGVPERFENRAEALGRYYDVHAFRLGGPGSRRVAVLFNDITDRKRAKDGLRESGERLRGVLDGMTEGFGLLSPDFTILEHNREALRMDGRPREEIVGRSHWEAYPGTKGSELGRLLEHAMGARVPVSLEHCYSFENGQARWLDMRAYPTPDGALAVFWRDVTDRKTAEAALQEQERQYRTLFESMDEAYAVVEVLRDEAGGWRDFRFVEVNQAFMVHTSMPYPVGRTATELLGTPNPRWAQMYGEALDTGKPIRVQEAEPVLDRVFDLNIFSLDRPRNRVAVLFTDITHRVRAEDALRASEARFRALATAGSYLAYRMSPDWRLLYQLDGRNVLTGTAEPIADWLARYILPEDRLVLQDAIAAAIRDRALFELEHRVRRADGSTGWVLSRAVPILDAAGEVIEWFGAASDVTARRGAEEALRASEERQAYLLGFSDALRPLSDPVAILEEATRLLRRRLAADRALYAEFIHDNGQDYVVVEREHRAPGTTSFVGRHEAAAFGPDMEALRAGRAIVIRDIEAEQAPEAWRAVWRGLGVRARLAVPLIKDGCLVAGLGVHAAAPRDWTDEEVALVVETGERTWAAVERARAAAALRESEERFRGFAENSADVLWIADAQGLRLQYLSPAYDAVFGASRDDALADMDAMRALVHPEDRATVATAMPRTLAGETVRIAYRVIRPADGRIVHLLDTGFPVRGPDGAIRQVAGIVQDVTEERRMARELAGRERHLRALVEGVPHLLWRAAAQGRWQWASPQWTAFTGLSDAQSEGHGWLAAVHPEDRDRILDAWRAVGEGGTFAADFRLRFAADGTWRWFRSRGIPLREDDAAEAGPSEWLGTSTDVDDQIRAREALERGRDELEERVRARTVELMAAEETLRQAQKLEAVGQLTGGIAHDFNNMLQGVAGALDMARRRMEGSRLQEAGRYIEAARDATGRAAGLTRRLLAFARRQQLEPRQLDADGLVRGMAEMLRRTLGPAIALELDLCDDRGVVTCDASELESALLNLCINARDAMAEGGGLVIATRARRLTAAELSSDAEPGEFLELSVADTGTGMSPEVREHVLEPFFTTKPLGQGTGLGLSQVYGFVRQSGGTLRIESAPGQGTTVRLWLPLTGRRPEAQGRAEETTGQNPQEGGNATLLLVDDETGVRAPAAERLRDLGYRVVEAPDGPSALRLLDEGLAPHLLITDVGLPGGMDGVRLAEAVLERRPGLPILFTTGYAAVALPAGAAVIAKPYPLDTLALRVRNGLAAASRAGIG
ncbi:PAS domain S-box protein [Falsiroseomonas bella]|uniref:PAS domain S-box protein n=1 Tax=Falsiroseomonas bella TaxID=2184016 RepID=UPI0011B6806D|nr:PAS domain S-box protein [Falsiroseomonas bella]